MPISLIDTESFPRLHSLTTDAVRASRISCFSLPRLGMTRNTSGGIPVLGVVAEKGFEGGSRDDFRVIFRNKPETDFAEQIARSHSALSHRGTWPLYFSNSKHLRNCPVAQWRIIRIAGDQFFGRFN